MDATSGPGSEVPVPGSPFPVCAHPSTLTYNALPPTSFADLYLVCIVGEADTPQLRADTTMEAAILAWLQNVAIRAFGISLFLLLAIDGAFALVLFATRDRGIVNRWTSRVLAVNLVLAGTGIGVPVLALGSRLAVRLVAPMIPSPPSVYINGDKDDDVPPAAQVRGLK